MIEVRRAGSRGHAHFGWLDSRHTFSFGSYHDPQFMGYRDLRVINEDTVAPGAGFGEHGHSDMEIISYVLDGALQHRDSLGTGAVIKPGEVQRMTAGTGIRHSEFNASSKDPVHFLQIWILPEHDGLPPGYEQKAFAESERRDRLRLVGSKDGREGSVTIHQDVDLYASLLGKGASVEHRLAQGRGAWVQVASGSLEIGGQALSQGDGAVIEDEALIRIRAAAGSEFLLFDLR